MSYRMMLLLPLLMLFGRILAQPLEVCQQAAEENYPLIRRYGMIEKTKALTLDNIAKAWLPQVTLSAQATYQSSVTSFPEEMQSLYRQAGIEMQGLRKDQYRLGVDVQQTVYDGGLVRYQKAVASEEAGVQAAETAVTLYQVRRRVNDMYFSLLLLDDRLRLNADLETLLTANEKRLASMFEHGTAAESDLNAVRAERMEVVQRTRALESERRTLADMLATFCGMENVVPEKPRMPQVNKAQGNGRPELRLAEQQLRLADAEEKFLKASLLPRLSLFAQGFYGYPGYNLFEDMMGRRWSLNGMVGLRLSWNIGALYTHRNDRMKLQLKRDMAQNSRDIFLFNNRLEQEQLREHVSRYAEMQADDAEIIRLRQSVRKAAESKLSHGIIDVSSLLREINAENAARLGQSMHEIQMLKEAYDLKYTTNN